jgi:UDP:flavonoid glycosyltransferase YjiC (YdhE family)
MLAVGSRGDVQPYVALGLGLKAAGHEVRLATHADFERFVTEHGLDFHPIGGSPRAMMSTDAGRRMSESGTNPIPFVMTFRRLFNEYAEEFFESSWEACRDADAILYAYFAFSGYDIGEKKGIPAFPALLQPMNRTRYFPLQPPSPPQFGNRYYNWTTFVVAQQMFGQAFKPPINRWRKRLGLDPVPFAGLYSAIDRKHIPVFYGYSPTGVPKPPDWGSHLHVTGYWFLDRPAGWQPPADLVEFLKAGKPPVYVGFGSMTTQSPRESAELVVSALRKAGQRGVLLSGWGALHASDLPDDVYCIESIPHDWLFPQMAAVVHHGGAGTTGAALRSGVPSFAVPFFGDQHFWGDRARKLGVGPNYVGLNRLTVDKLAERIRAAATDERMRRRAAVVGKRIRAEDGVGNAVRVFNGYVDHQVPIDAGVR